MNTLCGFVIRISITHSDTVFSRWRKKGFEICEDKWFFTLTILLIYYDIYAFILSKSFKMYSTMESVQYLYTLIYVQQEPVVFHNIFTWYVSYLCLYNLDWCQLVATVLPHTYSASTTESLCVPVKYQWRGMWHTNLAPEMPKSWKFTIPLSVF